MRKPPLILKAILFFRWGSWDTDRYHHLLRAMGKTEIWPQADWPIASLITIRVTLTRERFSWFSKDNGALRSLAELHWCMCAYRVHVSSRFLRGIHIKNLGTKKNHLLCCKTRGQEWGKGGTVIETNIYNCPFLLAVPGWLLAPWH